MYFYYLKISGKWEENFMNVLNTMADWEIRFLMAELHSKRYFKNKCDELNIVKMGKAKKSVTTMVRCR